MGQQPYSLLAVLVLRGSQAQQKYYWMLMSKAFDGNDAMSCMKRSGCDVVELLNR